MAGKPAEINVALPYELYEEALERRERKPQPSPSLSGPREVEDTEQMQPSPRHSQLTWPSLHPVEDVEQTPSLSGPHGQQTQPSLSLSAPCPVENIEQTPTLSQIISNQVLLVLILQPITHFFHQPSTGPSVQPRPRPRPRPKCKVTSSLSLVC
jgi:hypothetical protein